LTRAKTDRAGFVLALLFLVFILYINNDLTLYIFQILLHGRK